MKVGIRALKGIAVAVCVAGAAVYFRWTYPVVVDLIQNFDAIIMGEYVVQGVSERLYVGFAVFVSAMLAIITAHSLGSDDDSDSK